MSTTIIAVIVNLLAVILPQLGITIGSEALTNAITVVVTILTGLWIWTQRYMQGDINFAGIRKG